MAGMIHHSDAEDTGPEFVLVLSLVVVAREAFEDEGGDDDEGGKIVAARSEINRSCCRDSRMTLVRPGGLSPIVLPCRFCVRFRPDDPP